MGHILVGCEKTENEQIHEMSSIRIINGVGRNQWILITMVKSSLIVIFSSNILVWSSSALLLMLGILKITKLINYSLWWGQQIYLLLLIVEIN